MKDMAVPDDAVAHMRAHTEFDIVKVNPTVAFLLCLLLGGTGAHRFYLGRTTSATIMLIMFVASSSLILVGAAADGPPGIVARLAVSLTVPTLAAWMITDMIKILPMARRENSNRLARMYQRHGLPS
jgi:hypothetical protein